ncbi:MAG: 30S ribosomal protein S1 [Bacteroidetes bacterium]|nr:30S ribosomal protein S1 [Bacteroidota bacterium]MBU2584460.1 30S ribosomal protein S1 [Bacteroidota bacterium]
MSEETTDVSVADTTLPKEIDKSLLAQKNNFDFENKYSIEEFQTLANLYSKTLTEFKEGEIIKGRVIRVQGDNVIVDIGFKSEGSIPKDEFPDADQLVPGTEIDILLENVEGTEGELVLSKKLADFAKLWDKIVDAHDTQSVIQGKILKRIKGGLVADVFGLESFLPGSQIDIRPIRDFDAFIGKTLDLKIVKVNHIQRNVVVSHKVLIEEEIKDQRKAILDSLEKGQILQGTVKAITDFGVFIDLGGVDGLIHITDLSWGRVNHPSEMVKLDEVINCVVLDYDTEKKRISLGIKQLQEHPWKTIDQKYALNQRVGGKIVSLTDYGAFVEIEKGIEGLIHISEMSWTQHIKHPSQVVSMGQIVEAVILSVDKEEKKISLGLKQLEPDPWGELLKKYPVDTQHEGIVRNLTNFGVFVELEPGVDGLIHISDLSWTKKIRHPAEVVKKGDKIDVMVLGIDIEQRKISLGHKQLEENPWDIFEREYSVGQEIEATILRHIEKGVLVELPLKVDGFVPANHLSTSPIKNLKANFPEGDNLSLKVIEFDKENKKIVLSAIESLKDKEKAAVEEYIAKHKIEKMTIGDLFKEKERKKGRSVKTEQKAAEKPDPTPEVKIEEVQSQEEVQTQVEVQSHEEVISQEEVQSQMEESTQPVVEEQQSGQTDESIPASSEESVSKPPKEENT